MERGHFLLPTLITLQGGTPHILSSGTPQWHEITLWHYRVHPDMIFYAWMDCVMPEFGVCVALPTGELEMELA